MKRLLIICMLISVPAIVFLNVRQGYLFWQKEREVARLQDEQQQLFEENKLMIVNIAVASSPARVDELARKLDLIKTDQEHVTRLRLPKRGGDG